MAAVGNTQNTVVTINRKMPAVMLRRLAAQATAGVLEKVRPGGTLCPALGDPCPETLKRHLT